LGAIESSRRLILDEIGDPRDLTLARGPGNRGDDLIWAGTRKLLAEHIYREIDLTALCRARGHTVVLKGGGAFCRRYREHMPRALAVACLRFERVILLPSSFDPSEDEVRDALARTRATVFARELESYRRIVSLCDARLAHDCAFFFDFEPYRSPGRGTLNAFREDGEEISGRSLPADNDDISLTAENLDRWLGVIAEHELIRTDRAHVMIAAAMLGKRVEFGPCNYHKVDAIAQYALSDYPVTSLPAPLPRRHSGRNAKQSAPARVTSHRSIPPAPASVTAVVLTRDRPTKALDAVDSLRSKTVSLQTVVIDNNSAPAAAQMLRAGCGERDGVLLHRSDRNLGCAAGRQFALEHVASELVLFLDDDAELDPGALDTMVGELDAHPDAAAVTATVLLDDGTIQHSGGWMRALDGSVEFGPVGEGRQPDEAAVPASGPVDWVSGTAVLVRREVLDRFPIDGQMAAYYEDNEWSYRVELARPGSFRRSLEARAVHHRAIEPPSGEVFSIRSAAVERLLAHARFYERHGKLLDVREFDLVPELRDSAGGRDIAAARLLMELLLANGTDWTLMEWMNGNLDVLLSAGRLVAAQRADLDQQAARIAEQAQALAYFRGRHEELERVEVSFSWRLHEHILPVLSTLLWLRDRLRGRRCT
jgi:GT2 family glycosyltransferase/exopolysaccharide biosynthesis predicted pyruvyltransferase EpsI